MRGSLWQTRLSFPYDFLYERYRFSLMEYTNVIIVRSNHAIMMGSDIRSLLTYAFTQSVSLLSTLLAVDLSMFAIGRMPP